MMLRADRSQLTRVQRRCLRVLNEFPDLAHAARRLHWSRATLREVLSDLVSSLGDRHIHVDGDGVHLSDTLKGAIAHQLRLCGPVNENPCPDSIMPGELEMPGPGGVHGPQISG